MSRTKRNRYKDIVFLAAGCLCILLVVRGVEFWRHQQKSYEISIQSETELTEDIVTEIGKIKGVQSFISCKSCNVTLRLEEYMMETSIAGVDLDRYPFQWENAESEITLGNTPVLFLGEEAFSAFFDDHGNGPGRSRIMQWKEDCPKLDLTVTDENGRERNAKIGGILKEPVAGIYMSGAQMQELYSSFAKTTGGCIRIRGERNCDKAKELLSEAGFQVE